MQVARIAWIIAQARFGNGGRMDGTASHTASSVVVDNNSAAHDIGKKVANDNVVA